MSDNSAAEFTLLVSREHAENKLADAIRLFVGARRRFSVEQLAKGIGLPPNSKGKHGKPIYDFISYPSGHPDHRPLHLGIVLSITKFLGPEFTNEWLALAEQNAADAGPLDHEVIATKAIDYLSTKTAFHHPESECGPAIGPTEEETLDSKVVMFARVA